MLSEMTSWLNKKAQVSNSRPLAFPFSYQLLSRSSTLGSGVFVSENPTGRARGVVQVSISLFI